MRRNKSMRRNTSRPIAAVALTCGLISHFGNVFPALAAEPTKEQTEAMQGTWSIESFTLEGNALPADAIKTWRRIVEKDHVTWKNGAQTILETDMVYDPSQSPMTLDTKIATTESKGQMLLAIYELTHDTLKVCFAHPGKPRPTQFSSTAGSGQSLFIAKRMKP